MISSRDLFEFDDYRNYLKHEFSGKGERRGRRALLAAHLKCQTSFLSQILTDRAHLSLEHAIKTSEFLNHNEQEKKHFMLLVQKGKAGSTLLESYFEKQITELQKQREKISDRLNIQSQLSAEDQMNYYSTWYYSAIHILCALPGLNSIEAIGNKLKLETQIIKEALQFLERRGFIRKKDNHYEIGTTRIHLSPGSPMLPRHHASWRMKAIEAVDHPKSSDLHYSAILGISRSDQKKFKEKLLKLLQEFEPLVKNSKEEIPIVMAIDLFEL